MVLVLPVFLFLIFGAVEFGQFFYIRSAFVSAARDVARAASLQTAQQSDLAPKATATLAQANVTFNSTWMTLVDASAGNAAISDVTAVPYGHTIVVSIGAPYGSIANAFRPLSAFTGIGVGAGRVCGGMCRTLRE